MGLFRWKSISANTKRGGIEDVNVKQEDYLKMLKNSGVFDQEKPQIFDEWNEDPMLQIIISCRNF